MRIIIAFCVFVNSLVSASVRTGNLIALILAAFIYLQIQTDICTMRAEVRESLDKVACTAQLQDHVGYAQSFANNVGDIANMEANRAYMLDMELQHWMEDYDKLDARLDKAEIINRSMRVYIERLHRLLRENNVKIPPQQPRPLGG